MYLAKISLHGPMTLKQLRDVFGDPYQNDCHVGATIGEGLEEVQSLLLSYLIKLPCGMINAVFPVSRV